MQIAQVLAGYTLGGADLLRRAMGKKKPEEMAKQREIFVAGAVANQISAHLAENIFDLMEKFAGYGFNKSHSAAYALLAYQTAWLKTHYPAAFMAAVLSADLQNTDKIVTLIDECRAMGLAFSGPDVNIGEYQFSVSEGGGVIYGLGAIKGLGEGPVEGIIAARQSGPFTDLFDFCARVDGRRVNRRAIEALIRSGALDGIGPAGHQGYQRAVMLAAMEEAMKLAEQRARDVDSGMVDLFGGSVADSAPEMGYHSFAEVRGFSVKQRLQGEKDTLGLYLTGHPVDEYAAELQHFVKDRICELRPSRDNQLVAGLVVGLRTLRNKRGDSMAFLVLDDRSGRIEAAVFADQFREYRDKMAKDAVLVVEGVVSEDDYSGGLKMRVQRILTLCEARQQHLKRLVIDLDRERLARRGVAALEEILTPYRHGQCPLQIRYRGSSATGEIALGGDWGITPEDELLHQLRETFGPNSLHLRY